MRVEYAFHAGAGVPELEQLWAEQTDWGAEALRQLDGWFASAPFGSPHTVTATDRATGRLVGSFRFMPTEVVVDGRPTRGVRPFGTIVSPAASAALQSTNPLRQPAVAMYLLAVRELKAAGVQLVHMTPDPRWVRLFRMFPFLRTGTFPLWSAALPGGSLPGGWPPFPGGFEAAPLAAWDDEVDALAAQAGRLYGCMIARDRRMLRWKASGATHTVVAVRQAGRLVGVVAGRAKGDRQWLICDMITADAGASLQATLTAACEAAGAAARAAPLDRPLHKVAVLATPLMQPALGALGFRPDAYHFPLAVHVLDPSVPPDAVAPSRWYASATD